MTTKTNRSGVWWILAVGVISFWIYDWVFGGCEKYASKYSCRYVLEKADYEVYYWRNVQDDNEDDNRPIGRIVGLRACKDSALRYAALIDEPWNERAYVCVLVEDGLYMEKHRLLE